MSEQKHTAGPWTASPTGFGEEHTINAGSEEIALINASNGLDEPTLFPGAANARLIAAAPDMLKALKLCERHHATSPHIGLIRATIAKAEGRTLKLDERQP